LFLFFFQATEERRLREKEINTGIRREKFNNDDNFFNFKQRSQKENSTGKRIQKKKPELEPANEEDGFIGDRFIFNIVFIIFLFPDQILIHQYTWIELSLMNLLCFLILFY
jgi:hypothetical protein